MSDDYYGEDGRLDPRWLWGGCIATAVVAALVAVAGILIARGLFDVPVLAPKARGIWGSVNTGTYALTAAGVAVAAAGVMLLLSLAVPRPVWFFGWIMGLVTLIGVVLPLTLDVDFASKVATATINLAIGVVITILTNNTARSARTARRRRGTSQIGPDD